ncbi:sugar phosphate isomerase/epimerase family protein [Pseudoroseomonas globiformis]|uniref:Sugar phosphate isomerase/epimerase family protein n=1 Tax=Teichococcus globiformis TaxID=2307229 RepID=A0ABV7FWS2_9PROT
MRSLEGRPDLCSINTATLGHRQPIAEVIEAVARHGFGGIAPWRRDLEGEDVGNIARRIRDAGLAVTGYCRSTAFPAATPAAAAAALAENRAALRDAARLGASCFVIVAGSLPPGSRDLGAARRQLEDGVGALLGEARQLGVTLALEPLHPVYAGDRSCLCTLDEALDLCEAVDPGSAGGVGLAVDVYHVWWDARLAAALRRAGQGRRITAFHVCDWKVPVTDVLLDRGMMGDGVIDIPGIRRAVEAAGYAGKVEVEIFSARDWWQRPPEETLATCAARLERC